MHRILLAVTVGVWLAPLAVHATTLEYLDEGELYDKVPVVVVGQVLHETVKNELGMVRSHYQMEVTETLKGKVKPGTLLTYQTLGGQFPSGSGEYVEGSPHPAVGANVIVFLLGPYDGGEYFVDHLALGHYELRYSSSMHRYVAHRDLASVALMRSGPKRGATILPPDQIADDVLKQFRRFKIERVK